MLRLIKRKQFQLFVSTFTCAGSWPNGGSPTRQQILEHLGKHLFSFQDRTPNVTVSNGYPIVVKIMEG